MSWAGIHLTQTRHRMGYIMVWYTPMLERTFGRGILWSGIYLIHDRDNTWWWGWGMLWSSIHLTPDRQDSRRSGGYD